MQEKIHQWSSTVLNEPPESKSELAKLNAKERMRSDLASLKPLVKTVQKEYKAMDRCYSGEQLAEIEARASDVALCWKQLKNIYQESGSGESLPETSRLLEFLSKYADLRKSIDDVQEKLKGWPENIG